MAEATEQARFVNWWKTQYPDYRLALRASMLGTNLGSGKQGAIMYNKLKSQGAIKGEPDIAILVKRGGYGCLVVEHKGLGMAHKLTEEQEQHLDFHKSIGNKAVQTRGLDDLKNTVREYMELSPNE